MATVISQLALQPCFSLNVNNSLLFACLGGATDVWYQECNWATGQASNDKRNASASKFRANGELVKIDRCKRALEGFSAPEPDTALLGGKTSQAQ